MEVHALAGTLSVNLVSGPQGGSVYTHLCSGNSLLLHGTVLPSHAMHYHGHFKSINSTQEVLQLK